MRQRLLVSTRAVGRQDPAFVSVRLTDITGTGLRVFWRGVPLLFELYPARGPILRYNPVAFLVRVLGFGYCDALRPAAVSARHAYRHLIVSGVMFRAVCW